jgi:hypothetical protein
VSRTDLECHARKIWEEACEVDPARALEVARLVVGAEVWCWSSMPVRRLQTLSLALFATARLS